MKNSADMVIIIGMAAIIALCIVGVVGLIFMFK